MARQSKWQFVQVSINICVVCIARRWICNVIVHNEIYILCCFYFWCDYIVSYLWIHMFDLPILFRVDEPKLQYSHSFPVVAKYSWKVWIESAIKPQKCVDKEEIRIVTRSCKISKPWDTGLELSTRSNIWQATQSSIAVVSTENW